MSEYGPYKSAARLQPDWNAPAQSGEKKRKTHEVTERITVDRKNFPYLAGKGLGETCEVMVRVRKVEERVPSKGETDKDESITLDVLEIAEPKAGKAKSYEQGSINARS